MFWSPYKNEYSKGLLIFENWEEIFTFFPCLGVCQKKIAGRIERMKVKECFVFAKAQPLKGFDFH